MIRNATKTIKLASTSMISDEIIDALYQVDNVNIYMIVKSFDNAKATVDRFDTKKPALLREVESLKNNFIIIDDISYFFINPLKEKENIIINFDEKMTIDLSYIFNYYFWDCASSEKLIYDISIPTESPFPPIGQRELKYVNIKDDRLKDCVNLFIPRDKSFENELDKTIDNRYFSDDIKSSIYNKDEEFQVGNIRFLHKEFEIKNRYILKNDNLNNIETMDDIIPKDESWNDEINIQDTKDIKISNEKANKIEDMEDIKPNNFPKEKYVKQITYYWDVLPPTKPKDAKKSSLYGEFNKLNSEFNKELDYLEHSLNNLKKESGLLLKWFSGTARQTDVKLQKIREYRKKDLKKFSYIDLEEFIYKEFKYFYEDIIKSSKTFNKEKKKKEAQEKWEKEKEQKNKTLEKYKNELVECNDKLSKIEAKPKIKLEINTKNTTNKTDALTNGTEEKYNKTKLEKNIKSTTNKIDTLTKEIKERYTNFNYKPKESELNNLKSNQNQKEYKALKLPKYILPNEGVLYENANSYFLQIEYENQLKKANELSQRYKDKDNYKVVVGDNNE
jgi:hypothetical protein